MNFFFNFIMSISDLSDIHSILLASLRSNLSLHEIYPYCPIFAGIEFYILNIDYSKLADAKVWKDAAVQIFFSFSASLGDLFALAR